MPTVTVLPYLFRKIIRINRAWIDSQKLRTLSFLKQQHTRPFRFSPSVAEAFLSETYRSHCWTRCACAKDRNMQICSRKCSARARKSRSRSLSEVSRGEHRIRGAASRIGLRNQSVICKNVSCLRESMAESIDRAPAKTSPAKRRRFQTS